MTVLVDKLPINGSEQPFNKIDIVLSPALGGIIAGYEIGRQLNTQTIFAERTNDKLVLRRGFEIPKN